MQSVTFCNAEPNHFQLAKRTNKNRKEPNKKRKNKYRMQNAKKRVFGRELQNQTEPIYVKKFKEELSTASSSNESPEKKAQEKELLVVPRRNPQLVEAYRERIDIYLTKRDKTRMVSLDSFNNQEDISAKNRSVLVDWLIDVACRFTVLDETLSSAVWMLDRYFEQVNSLSRDRLQLIGVTCLMLSAKLEEIYPPSLKDFQQVCAGAYTELDLLDTEAQVLSVLGFDLTMTCALTFYKSLTRSLEISGKAYFFGEYLLTVSLLNMDSYKYSFKELACGAVFLINKMFKLDKKWGRDFEDLFKVPESKVKTTAKGLYRMLKANGVSGLEAAKRKFGKKETFEVSKIQVERSNKTKTRNAAN